MIVVADPVPLARVSASLVALFLETSSCIGLLLINVPCFVSLCESCNAKMQGIWDRINKKIIFAFLHFCS